MGICLNRLRLSCDHNWSGIENKQRTFFFIYFFFLPFLLEFPWCPAAHHKTNLAFRKGECQKMCSSLPTKGRQWVYNHSLGTNHNKFCPICKDAKIVWVHWCATYTNFDHGCVKNVIRDVSEMPSFVKISTKTKTTLIIWTKTLGRSFEYSMSVTDLKRLGMKLNRHCEPNLHKCSSEWMEKTSTLQNAAA